MIVSVKQNGRGKSTNTFNEKNAIGENEEKTDLQSNNQWSTCRRNCETMMIQTKSKMLHKNPIVSAIIQLLRLEKLNTAKEKWHLSHFPREQRCSPSHLH